MLPAWGKQLCLCPSQCRKAERIKQYPHPPVCTVIIAQVMLQKEAVRAFLGEDTPSAGWRTQAVREGVRAGVGLGKGVEGALFCCQLPVVCKRSPKRWRQAEHDQILSLLKIVKLGGPNPARQLGASRCSFRCPHPLFLSSRS